MKRNIGLDVLRGIAVILVLFRHCELHPFLSRIGWIGVDLFFVLSGFLVSGLIFKEYKTNNTVNIKRFLIRRGFKIYPSFFFFILIGLIISIFYPYFPKSFGLKELLSEVFFLQSYLPHIWNHTWSVAVEEHFYLFLAALITLLSTVNSKVFFYRLFLSSIFVILLVTFYRIFICLFYKNHVIDLYYMTHSRIDTLTFGMLISIMYHFKFELFQKVFKNYRWILIGISTLCIMPSLYFPVNSVYISSVGFSLLMVSFGIILVFVTEIRFDIIHNKILIILINTLKFIGFNSYNIYLWHLFVYFILILYLPYPSTFTFIIYTVLCVMLGWFMSTTIEKWGLDLRNKIAP